MFPYKIQKENWVVLGDSDWILELYGICKSHAEVLNGSSSFGELQQYFVNPEQAGGTKSQVIRLHCSCWAVNI